MILLLALTAASAAVEPMLDGQCDEHVPLGLPASTATVSAFVRQTEDHVWLCFAVPEGSYASLDLRIEAPGLPKALNLHASAQLGEWTADDPSAAPANASSAAWWNVSGWWANVTPFNGAIATPQGRQINFRTVRGRELQLSKRRFGTGEWKLSAVLADVREEEGRPSNVRWPAEGVFRLEVR